MFKNNMLLRADQHGDVKVAETHDWRFAAGEMLLPLVYSEMADAAREYPLVFAKDKSMLYALTGIENGINAYVAEDGHWLATYIPGRLRAYPLALTPVPDKPGDFALVLDSDAPQLLAKEGELLFRNGEATPFLKQRMNLLKSMQEAEATTQMMVRAIRKADLLVERVIQVNKPDGEESRIGGIQVIDENRFNKLSNEDFIALREAGVLPLIYSHLLSMANLRQGALVGKYPELAREKTSDDFSLEEFLSSDTLKFN